MGLLTFVGCEKEIKDGPGMGATDVDGNTYKSVIIGEQEWFAENLRTTKYSDGLPIPNIVDATEWLNDTNGARTHYNYNYSGYESTFGALYNGYAVNTNKLCPTGWHVPTDAEWTVLTDYLASDGHSGKEGTALKATSGWDNKDDGTSGNGTDDYGFLALPSGERSNYYVLGYLGDLGKDCFWWSSSQHDTYGAWYRTLSTSNDLVDRRRTSKSVGFSVRCIRD